MQIRRFNPVADEGLLRMAFSWDAYAPDWYSTSDSLFRPDSEERFLELTRNENQVDIGVFDGEMIGLITFDHKGNGVFEIRLSAKRGSSLETLTEAAYQVRHQIFSIGARLGIVWVEQRNRHVIKLCGMIGFVKDGLTMYRGTHTRKKLDDSFVYRPIVWVRMITTREQWLGEQKIAA